MQSKLKPSHAPPLTPHSPPCPLLGVPPAARLVLFVCLIVPVVVVVIYEVLG